MNVDLWQWDSVLRGDEWHKMDKCKHRNMNAVPRVPGVGGGIGTGGRAGLRVCTIVY